jgi:hypothetical protein
VVDWTKCISAAGIGLLLTVELASAQSSVSGARKPAGQIGGPKEVYNPVMPGRHTAASAAASVTALPSRNQGSNTGAIKGTSFGRFH